MPSRTPKSRPAASVPSNRLQTSNIPDPPPLGLSGRVRRLRSRYTSIPGLSPETAVRQSDPGGVRRDAEPSEGISFADEDLLSAKQVAELLPPRRLNRRLHVSTVHRWWTYGYRGVRLESIRIGGQRFTSLQALQRFFDRLSQADENLSLAPSRPLSTGDLGRRHVPARRDSVRHRRIEKELDELGL